MVYCKRNNNKDLSNKINPARLALIKRNNKNKDSYLGIPVAVENQLLALVSKLDNGALEEIYNLLANKLMVDLAVVKFMLGIKAVSNKDAVGLKFIKYGQSETYTMPVKNVNKVVSIVGSKRGLFRFLDASSFRLSSDSILDTINSMQKYEDTLNFKYPSGYTVEDVDLIMCDRYNYSLHFVDIDGANPDNVQVYWQFANRLTDDNLIMVKSLAGKPRELYQGLLEGSTGLRNPYKEYNNALYNVLGKGNAKKYEINANNTLVLVFDKATGKRVDYESIIKHPIENLMFRYYVSEYSNIVTLNGVKYAVMSVNSSELVQTISNILYKTPPSPTERCLDFIINAVKGSISARSTFNLSTGLTVTDKGLFSKVVSKAKLANPKLNVIEMKEYEYISDDIEDIIESAYKDDSLQSGLVKEYADMDWFALYDRYIIPFSRSIMR